MDAVALRMHWQQTLDAFETSAVEDESLLTAAKAGVLPGATANVVCAVEYRLERKKALATGIKALDVLTPLGRGQCMLLTGEPGTGLTRLGVSAVAAQAAQLAEGDAALIPGQMASFLAGLTSVRDAVMKEKYSVVEVALFLIDSLMHKLPETFSRAFRKEGTVHAVEALCAQRVDAETAAVAAAAKATDANTGGNITPRDQVVPAGVGSGSAASIVARMALAGKSGSGKKPSDTPQRRAAVERAVALRAAPPSRPSFSTPPCAAPPRRQPK